MAQGSREDELLQLFPGTTPCHGAPTMFRINGCGLAIYGHRDVDLPTNTYVTTYCLCFLFIPVLALSAYRIQDAPGGNAYYFIRKAPLSTFARVWNCLLLIGILGGIGSSYYHAYTTSPEYIAAQRIKSADALSAAGKPVEAAALYRTVALNGWAKTDEAVRAFQTMLDKQLPTATPDDAEKLLQTGFEIAESGRTSSWTSAQCLTHCQTYVDQSGKTQPAAALKVLDLMDQHTSDKIKKAALVIDREMLLRSAAAQKPDDVYIASCLAEVYEKQEKFDLCEKLLAPLAAKLGTYEGARILGQIYSRQEKMDEAIALLDPYTLSRLPHYATAEKAANEIYKQSGDDALQRLRNGGGGFDFNNRFEAANANDRITMVDKYIEDAVAKDPRFTHAMAELKKHAGVVPAALDLAILHLRRAQRMFGESGTDNRDKELRAAEKLFLAIRATAGESNEFQLYFGQVCYWLGKHAEGKKEFDTLMTKNKRSSIILLQIAVALRSVGEDPEARALMEEAYGKETDAKVKQQIAYQQSVLCTESEERLKWLQRSNTADPRVKADLDGATAYKLSEQGDYAGAAALYRKTAEFYASQPKNSTMLNNAAVGYMEAFAASSDPADFKKGLALMEESGALAPDNAINIMNLSDYQWRGAILEVLNGAIDLKKIKAGPSMELLRFLYRNQATRDEVAERLRSNANFKKVMDNYERLMVLAPKRIEVYRWVAEIALFVRDTPTMKAVRERLSRTTLDFSTLKQQQADARSGKHDTENSAQLRRRMAENEKLADSGGLSGINLCVALCQAVEAGEAGSFFGDSPDPDKIVALAERAVKADDNSRSTSILRSAICFRAVQTLAKSSRDWADFLKETARTLGNFDRLSLAAFHPGPLQDALLANADFKRLVELEATRELNNWNTANVESYAILKVANPAAAKSILEKVNQFELGDLHDKITQSLNPEASSTTLNAYWHAQAAGNESGAKAIIADAVKRGVELPAMLKRYCGL